MPGPCGRVRRTGVARTVADILVGGAVAVAVSWVALLVGLLIVRPKGTLPTEALRVLPDLLRLLRRLAGVGWPGSDRRPGDAG